MRFSFILWLGALAGTLAFPNPVELSPDSRSAALVPRTNTPPTPPPPSPPKGVTCEICSTNDPLIPDPASRMTGWTWANVSAVQVPSAKFWAVGQNIACIYSDYPSNPGQYGYCAFLVTGTDPHAYTVVQEFAAIRLLQRLTNNNTYNGGGCASCGTVALTSYILNSPEYSDKNGHLAVEFVNIPQTGGCTTPYTQPGAGGWCAPPAGYPVPPVPA